MLACHKLFLQNNQQIVEPVFEDLILPDILPIDDSRNILHNILGVVVDVLLALWVFLQKLDDLQMETQNRRGEGEFAVLEGEIKELGARTVPLVEEQRH